MTRATLSLEIENGVYDGVYEDKDAACAGLAVVTEGACGIPFGKISIPAAYLKVGMKLIR